MKNLFTKDINKQELNEVISLSKRILKLLYVVFIACLVLAIIIAVQKLNILNIVLDFLGVISPFFIGFVLAWLLRPLVLKLNKKVKNNTWSAFIVFAGFVLIFGIILYIFIPTVYNEVNELVGLLPGFIEKITTSITDIFNNFSENGINLSDFQNKLLESITTGGAELAKNLPNYWSLFIN